MYARLTVLVCLLSASASAGALPIAESTAVELYLKSDGGSSPAVLNEMKAELAALMDGAGLRIDWWTAKDSSSGVEGDLVVIDLRGTCTPPLRRVAVTPLQHMIALASSAMTDGRILPFSWVDCGALNGFLSSSISALSIERREEVYGRALARLLAHELYHVITQRVEHAEAGLAKARFSLTDLIGGRLDFRGVSLSKPAIQTARRWKSGSELNTANSPAVFAEPLENTFVK